MKLVPSREDWLVLSYYYKADGMACSHHIEDRISALNALGIDTQILSRVEKHSAPFIKTEGYSVYWARMRSTIGTERIVNAFSLVLALLRGSVLVLREWDEVTCVLSLAEEGYEMTRKRKFTRIYSTGGPMSAHIAALLIAARTRLPITVEFQDPLPFQYPGRFRKLALMLEKLAMKRAHCVFMTRQAAEMAAKRCWRPMPEYIYPGARKISPHISAHSASQLLQFGHFGTLHGDRNARFFLQALENVGAREPEATSTFRLHCYGALDRDTMRMVAEFPLPQALLLHEKVERSEAIEIMQKMDVLLLVQHTNPVSSETIPSKAYEYMQTGRLIFALVYKNPELAKMLGNLGHIAVDAADPRAIQESLESLIEQWKKGALPVPLPSPYTPEAAARKLYFSAKASRRN